MFYPLRALLSFTFVFLIGAAPSLAESSNQPLAQNQKPTIIEHDDKTHVFKNNQTRGTFVLYDVSQDTLHLVNSSRAKQPFIPASTFKIANSLIALEMGVIADENEIIPYGGGRTFIKAWAQDMPLHKAFTVSNLPVYQELARRIGLQSYKTWLNQLGYGNTKTGQNVETFWLRGPLKISAIDQTKFLAKLANKQLPLSDRAQSIVSEISIVDKKDGKILHGKTGWTTTPNPDIGWYVGWVEHENNTYTFALNIDMSSRKDASKRRQIAEAFLAMFDVY